MLAERVRPTFGNPRYIHTFEHIRSFPDAKLRIVPSAGWVKDESGQKRSHIGLYNGAVNPATRVIISEKLWKKLQTDLKPQNPEDNDKLILPEWAVLKISKASFGINRASVLEEVDLSQSGDLQQTLEF